LAHAFIAGNDLLTDSWGMMLDEKKELAVLTKHPKGKVVVKIQKRGGQNQINHLKSQFLFDETSDNLESTTEETEESCCKDCNQNTQTHACNVEAKEKEPPLIDGKLEIGTEVVVVCEHDTLINNEGRTKLKLLPIMNHEELCGRGYCNVNTIPHTEEGTWEIRLTNRKIDEIKDPGEGCMTTGVLSPLMGNNESERTIQVTNSSADPIEFMTGEIMGIAIWLGPTESVKVTSTEFLDIYKDKLKQLGMLEEDLAETLPNITKIEKELKRVREIHKEKGFKPKTYVCSVSKATLEQDLPSTVLRHQKSWDDENESIMELQSSDMTEEEWIEQFDIAPNLNAFQRRQVKTLLIKHRNDFTLKEMIGGNANTFEMPIDLEDTTPWSTRPRPLSQQKMDILGEYIQKMANAGVIRPSNSPWSASPVVILKPNGKWRICIDYREINKKMKTDTYALPRIDHILQQLSGMKYFTSTDLCSGFWQLPVKEEHRERTAFVTPHMGLWEFVGMPFGLKNAPAVWQRIIDTVIADAKYDYLFGYVDDILCASHDWDSHLIQVEDMLNKCSRYNLKLSPKKTRIGYAQVEYLGHIVNGEGIKTDPKKVEKVKNFP
jgi:hypothetical protein